MVNFYFKRGEWCGGVQLITGVFTFIVRPILQRAHYGIGIIEVASSFNWYQQCFLSAWRRNVSFWQTPFLQRLRGVWHMNNWSIICGALPWIEHHAARQLSQLMETRQLSQDSICLWHRESNNHFLRNYEQCFSKTTKWKECWSLERDILLINWLIADCVNSTWAADISPLRRIFLWYFSSSPFPAAWQGRQFEVRGANGRFSFIKSHPHLAGTQHNTHLFQMETF